MVSTLDGAEFNGGSTARGTDRPHDFERLDVFDRMEADHKRLRFLLDRLYNSRAAAPALLRLFDLLCDALEGYGAASEQSLYAEVLVRAETDDKWPARHAVAVHDMSELLTFELSGLELAGEDWRAGLRQLSEYLEDHFRLEADEIFPLARMLLGREEAARLGDKYEQVKRDWIDRFGRAPVASQPQSVKRAQISGTIGAATRSRSVAPPFGI